MPKRGTCFSCRPQGRLRTSWEGSWPPSVDAAGKDVVVVNLLCIFCNFLQKSPQTEVNMPPAPY